MELFDAVFLGAEVTIVILGFSGIVVVFGRISSEGCESVNQTERVVGDDGQGGG